MRILIDEMYPPGVALGLRAAGLDAVSVDELGLGGASDHGVFAAAVADRYAVLTENVADFTKIAADHNAAGEVHHGLLIALSGRFSRRPGGIPVLVAAIAAIADQPLDGRVVYLARPRG